MTFMVLNITDSIKLTSTKHNFADLMPKLLNKFKTLLESLITNAHFMTMKPIMTKIMMNGT